MFLAKIPRTVVVVCSTLVVILSCTVSVVQAGDACCKAEAARRALIDDPFAVKPEFWDDEDDGPWVPPKISMADLPAWYRLLRESMLGLEGAAPLLISGVIVAALLTTIVKPLVPSVASLLGQQGIPVLDSLKGSIFGLVVPFCSCGALPLAVTLKQEGVSSSSIAAFVTAAQAAGIDSMFFTYGVFGARVAILRLVAAGVLAFLVGMTLKDEQMENSKDSSNGSCCGNNSTSTGSCSDETPKAGKAGLVSSISIFVSTAVELFASVAPWVFVGVLVSAVASIWAPPTSANPMLASNDAMSTIHSIASRAILFLLSLPLTICEHGIVSLADALRKIGFSAGTAVALIVTGPSTNAGTLLLLSRGSSKSLVVAAGRIVLVILVFGVTLSYLADDFGTSVLLDSPKPDQASGFELPAW
eukprot:CAMPEP_0116154742 /NCGR_PEP_ID=MMETSP0329-20121206/21942_1 /TAXON_ID=697910 /ORGANISM="Pseudo-nitzschia arenysensis, Strain B593" /LENGTH=415 /DNA_ID=CAMNT_0003651741 /DNA_START=98 /DNA_END=1342 /DNA_ORIENTATION=-